MDYSPLKTVKYKYVTHGSDDIVLTLRVLIIWASIAIPVSILIAWMLYSFVGKDYYDRNAVAGCFGFGVIWLSAICLNFLKSDHVKDARAWHKFAKVNGLKHSLHSTAPEILERASGVDHYDSEAVTIGHYKLFVSRARFGIIGDYSPNHGDSFDRKHYTIAHFQLDGYLPHIFINNATNDPYWSILGASNIENIYGLSSFKNQHTAKNPHSLKDADIFSRKQDAAAVKKVLDKLSQISGLLDKKPYLDIEMHNNNLWLIFNGDRRTPGRLSSVIQSATTFSTQLGTLNKLTSKQLYPPLKAALQVY